MRQDLFSKRFQKPLWSYSVLAISIAFSHQCIIAAESTGAVSGDVEEIYVTGSRIIRKDLESASPVTVIDAAQIKVSGATSVADVLQALPSMVGNAVTTSTTNGGGAGAADVTLRGLPSKQTLVLLNGRRMPNDGVTGVTPDLNMIPFAAVEQVEVLKDGASAIYGSDAIAGVVNIKLKKDFEGLVINTYGGLSSREDYPKQAIDFTYGSNFDRGNLLVSLSYYDQGTIQASDRDVSATAINLSSYMPQGTLSAPDFGGSLSSGSYIPSSDGSDWKDFQAFNSGADGFNYQAYTDTMIEQERRSLFTAGRYEVNNSITAFFEGTYGQTFNSYNMAPAPMNAATEKYKLTYSANNTHNPFGRDLNSVKRRFNELGSRVMLSENTMFRMVAGLEGEFDNGWYWDASLNYGESNTIQNTKNIVNKTRLRMAMGDSAACEAVGCVPIDLFGANSITPSMADWISTDGTEKGTAGLRSLTTNITGELFDTGTVGLSFASGIEYRQEYIKFLPGGEYQNNDTIGGTNLKSSKGDREVAELYTELLMPLWDGLFDIELAGRYSHYNDFGSTFNPKLGLKFRPLNEVLLRASVAKGFRAPSLLEMHRGEAESFDYLNDPCQQQDNVGSSAYNCTKQANKNTKQFTTFYGGNEDLDPERSTSLTVGMVFTPEIFEGFNFKLDYFRVSTEDAISVDADYILDQYRQGNGYDNLVVIDNATNNVLQVSSPYQNLAKREVRGVDFGVDTLFSLDRGDLTLRFEATRFLEFRTQGSKEAAYENVVGRYERDSGGGMGSIPEIKGHFDVVFATQDWTYSWITNYVSKLTEYSGGEKNTMDEWVTFDARLGYNYEPWGLDLGFGIDNITDREPPTSLVGNDNIDSKTHNLIGRYFYAQVGVQVF